MVLMDLNYAFDPFAQVKRLFQHRRDMTLLVDEAHHAVERVRDSLSGALNSRELAHLRAQHGKRAGRKTPYYRALTALIHELRALGAEEAAPFERTLDALPEGIAQKAEEVLALALQQLAKGEGTEAGEAARMLMGFRYAVAHLDEDYAVLLEGRGRERTLTVYCLLPGDCACNARSARFGFLFGHADAAVRHEAAVGRRGSGCLLCTSLTV